MSPGTYLQKRREAAGLTVEQLAVALGVSPGTIRPIRGGDFDRLKARLLAAEKGNPSLTMQQAALVRRIFHFDLSIYELLLIRESCETPSDFPEPQICSGCGASWLDTCACPAAPAAALAPNPTICTVCRHRESIAGPVPPKGERQ
ncbi:hypothetical protein LH128_01824 [Sphingomonas sp. LH128]|nr:hypothetical protein LH128_01824 [Sphingomonas sp. LH128]